MPKATLIFKLPEEEQEFEIARKAGSYYGAIHDIGNQVFRPARKHGYSDESIQKLLEEIDLKTDMKGTDLIALLEQLYSQLLISWDLKD